MSGYEFLSAVYANHDTRTEIGCDLGVFFRELSDSGKCDVAILSTEEGFSPLGASREFLEVDLGVSYEGEIAPLVRWLQYEKHRVGLLAVKSKNPEGALRGAVFVPGSGAHGVGPLYSSVPVPDEKFYYRATYAAVHYVCTQWGAMKVALSHFCSGGQFNSEMAKAHVYAAANFCDQMILPVPESFVFCGCCIRRDHLKEIEGYDWVSDFPEHIPFSVSVEKHGEFDLIYFDMV
jgi:hypothetical protein